MKEASESTEEILQKLFALITIIWSTFFSLKNSKNLKNTEKSKYHEKMPLGVVSGREREMFIESFWWLLHRVSGFSYDISDIDWCVFVGTLDPEIPRAFDEDKSVDKKWPGGRGWADSQGHPFCYIQLRYVRTYFT